MAGILTIPCLIHYRAAEALLKRVNKLFGDPRKRTEELKNEVRDKLADYQDKVDDALDLLREATNKIREANRLSAINQGNMTSVEVRCPTLTV